MTSKKAKIQVVIGVIHNSNGEILVVRKREDVNEDDKFLHGKWHMPGGKVESSEDLETATIREVLEETNIEVKVIELLGERIEEERGLILYWYLCSPSSEIDQEVHHGSDVTEAKFISRYLIEQFCDPTVVDQWPEEVRKTFI